MSLVGAVVLWLVISRSWCIKHRGLQGFPRDFKFGVATSAYQIEGAWNKSDKSENIWDRVLHTQSNITMDGGNGDVACDSYRHWKRDVDMVAELGADMYRFSISWSRLLPSGFSNHISKDGRRYYNDLINRLLMKGIEPVVTLYNLDLPQSLQDLGGWANPMITDWFADYARVVFTLYADRVKIWVTINQPLVVCDGGYGKMYAPYLDDMKVGVYSCTKNVLIAHAKAYRIYDQEFKHMYHGKVSIANLFFWFEPETPYDREVTELMFQLWEGRFAHPIFSKKGGWPPALEKVLNRNSRKEGYAHPRLPPFTKEEIDLVKGTHDFYGLNHYTTRLVRKVMPGFAGSWPFYGSEEIGAALVSDPSWTTAIPDWFAIYPEGLRKQLHWLNHTYGVQDILITENGFPTFSKDLFDLDRISYMRRNLKQVLLALNDGIKVIGYTAYSLMDSFDWMGGYLVNYGLYSVDFSSPQRTRRPRHSAQYFSSVAKTRTISSAYHGLIHF